MGVTASMSIAIVVNETLWGLYSFHSYTAPVSPTVEQRIILEMAASISATRVTSFVQEEVLQRRLNTMAVLGALSDASSLYTFMDAHAQQILAVAEADALAVCVNDNISAMYGDKTLAPTLWGLRVLRQRCQTESTIMVSAFSAGLGGNGCGVAYMRASNIQLAIIRRSHSSDVVWGGNPDEAKLPGLRGLLEPRASFEAYVEKGRMEAKPWTVIDREVIFMITDSVRQFVRAEMLKSCELSLEGANNGYFESQGTAEENFEYFAHMSHELR
jgi:two-component system, chemotaxis family, sensor kinase Cph1